MQNLVPEAWLDCCLNIAQEAGDAIMRVYATDFDVHTKDDASPLTEADIAAHNVIQRGLKRLAPRLPLLSEEGAQPTFEERRGWDRYWLIDPLDGTKEFVKKNDEFTVNIALIDHGVPVLGVVHAPALAATYAGMVGQGAWRISNGDKSSITTRPCLSKPVLVVSKSHRNAALESFLQTLPAHEATHRGSSLKFCLIAEGSADFYPRTGPTSEWDTAAGQAVVEAAGGVVMQVPDWRPLRYNSKESLLNPNFAVIGDPHHDWQRVYEQA